MSSVRKKKIKTLLSRMNKQNLRLVPIAPPLIEMMHLTTSEDELDYLLQMGTGLFDAEQAAEASRMQDDAFQPFFDRMKRKGLIHIELDAGGNETYRLNAIAVGWYEAMMHYNAGKPQEKIFSEKWNDFFEFFRKFNFFPLRNIQNIILPNLLKPSQHAALADPKSQEGNKRKTIPINSSLTSNAKVYPSFLVNDLIEEYGDKKAIYAFPCVCRHGRNLTVSGCDFDMPGESCMGMGNTAEIWAGWGYGRNISKAEAVDIIQEVREKGAVHSVIHEKEDPRLPVAAICNCCWDCCGILKPYNMGAVGLMYQASYTARIKDDANCKACGNCEKYCPTTAMKMIDKSLSFDPKRCIGCGQCAFQCRQNNIEMIPGERSVYLPILKKSDVRVAA